MKLTSMKLDKSDREEMKPSPDAVLTTEAPTYPWGLQVRLDDKALDKLGMDTLPKVDGELMLMARVKVVSVSSNEYTTSGEGKRKNRNVELQICDMALGDVPAEKNAADSLYKG